MEKEKLLKEFEEKFELMKKKLKFKASLKEIDNTFYLKDVILKEGYVPNSLSRNVCAIINDRIRNWGNYLHGLIMPNPQSILSVHETQMFDEAEKKEFAQILYKLMALSTTDSVNALTKNKQNEGKFIDDALTFWKKDFQPKLEKILKKINKNWKDKINPS